MHSHKDQQKKQYQNEKKKKKRFAGIMTAVLQSAGRAFHSLTFWTFFLILLAAAIPVLVINQIDGFYYGQAIMESELAGMQTRAAAVADELNGYHSLQDAENAGVYNSLAKYSNMNTLRIRVTDENFVVTLDSYSLENGKQLVNQHAIDAYSTGKSVSEYDKATGTVETAVPLLSPTGVKIGVFVMDMDVTQVNAYVDTVKERTNLVRVAIIVLMGAFAVLIARWVKHKFNRIRKITGEIANGHTGMRMPQKDGFTEIQSVAVEFNTIMDHANTLDESRQEFVSNVSHELKTPMTSMKVLADSLNTQDNVPLEVYKDFMQDITAEIDRENKIIEDLLTLVRMDKSASTLNLSSVNLNELMEMALKRLTPIADKKNVEILFESFRPVVAEVDEGRMSRAITNLVENAIKYNNDGGWVHVSLNADYQYFYIRVEDNGIGIPEEYQEQVFERFYRVDKARSRETGGTGLGLAIVKNIVLLHHGTIKLHSEQNEEGDSGTVFTIRIPLNYTP